MAQIDAARLVKLLNMTASPHDAEALAAARHSNEMLRAAGMSWGDVVALRSEPTTTSQGRQEPDGKDAGAAAHPRGDDLFGNDAAMPPPAGPSAKAAMQARIRAVPLFARVALFPLWGAAESYAAICLNERGIMWVGAIATTAAITVAMGALWCVAALSFARQISAFLG